MANLIQALVITSDPQYPWTPCSDSKSSPTCPEDDDTKRRRSEELIREQYNNVNSYTDTVSNASVLINGDITAYGHNSLWSPEKQWDKMRDLLSILKKPYYFGLGNHDIEGNEGIYFDTSMQRYINHVKSLNLPSSQFDYKREVISPPPQGGSATLIESGSFGYAVDFGHIYSIQLNNFPTMKRTYAVPGSSIRMFENLNWLEEQLQKAQANNKIIIVNVHKPNDWTGGPNQRFKNLLKDYRVAAVFCGHYHFNCGDYTNDSSYSQYFGDIPVFLSGSASQRTYLILEHVELKLNIYSVRNNNWKEKKLEKSIPVPVVSGHYKILTTLNNSMVLSQNPNKNIVLTWKNPDLIDGSQKWSFIYDPIEEAYQIQGWFGTSVMVRNVSDNNVHLLHPYPQKEEYYWILQYFKEDDSYIIKNKRDPNYVLDVDGTNTSDGTNIKVELQHDLNSPLIKAQKFKLERL
ncbi:metallophosphoesterase [Brevibacterium sp. JNUCC-42]|nr:metallophosphoesterase [Brevibacterium sp. JNUCC-42]